MARSAQHKDSIKAPNYKVIGAFSIDLPKCADIQAWRVRKRMQIDSNYQPADLETAALPIELYTQKKTALNALI